MKKKVLIIITVLVLIFCIGLLSSCEALRAKSLYEMAVENGYTGSEAEWLETLKGEAGLPGKDGKDGKNGVDGEYAGMGLSAYEVAVNAGFEGSEAEWLASLNGVDGSGNSISSASSKALLSGVAIISNFTTLQGTAISGGAGVIYKDDTVNNTAYIITNYHVVYSKNSTKPNGISDKIWVYLYGTIYPSFTANTKLNSLMIGEENKGDALLAEYVGGSYNNDIAVLKLTDEINEGYEQSSYDTFKASDSVAVEVGTSKNSTPGDTAIAIGNPEGDGISATSGVISVDSEEIFLEIANNVVSKLRVMRIDTAVNRGNSGGGLYDEKGKLIGIVNAKNIESGTDNISYALPIDLVAGVADSIIESAVAQKLVLGVTVKLESSKAVSVEDSTLYSATYTNNGTDYVPSYTATKTYKTIIEQVIKVHEIENNSYAQSIGFEVGDIFIDAVVGGKTYAINRLFTLSDALYNAREGQTLVFRVWRDENANDIKDNGEIKILTYEITAETNLVTVD